jgi:archaellum biogenesis ATPase FlaH
LYSAHKEGSEQPKREALMECLMKMLRLLQQDSAYIIIDALDECPTSGIPSSREEILEVVQKVVDLDISNLRICLTSRPEPDICDALQQMSLCCICLHDERGQAEDMAAYVCWLIESDPKTQRWRANIKALVIETLSQKACGM